MRMLIALSVFVFLAGCAQTPGASSHVQRQVDAEYVNQVEAAARLTSLRIYWVNPPTKLVQEDDNKSDQRD